MGSIKIHATVTLKPVGRRVTEEEVYQQFHMTSEGSSLYDDGDGQRVEVETTDLEKWLRCFSHTYPDGSGDCQRYYFLGARALVSGL